MEEFLDFLSSGTFIEAGRMRMRPREGGPDGGFAISKANMSDRLVAELLRRRAK